jgi:PII-like signaling protein
MAPVHGLSGREETPVRLAGRAVRLSIFVGEGDVWHHRPVYSETVHRAHKTGLAGATVVLGLEGFGRVRGSMSRMCSGSVRICRC